MGVGGGEHHPAAGRPGEEANLHQIRLVDILDGHRFLSDDRRQGVQAHRAAVIVPDHGLQHPPIHHVQAQLIHLQAIERLPEQSRRVVKLICLNNYSYADAASELGVSLATIKTHMYRSIKSLRKMMALFFF